MFDLTIRGGTVATSEGLLHTDIGVSHGIIETIGAHLPAGRRDIDASGHYVLPGGIDSHCHIEQRLSMGAMSVDDFYSATVSAAFGGTTTIIPFAAQHRGDDVLEVVDDYAQRARERAVIDYAFHLILSDPTDKTLTQYIPEVVRRGITSFKVYMTYQAWRLDDFQLLDVLDAADRHGALVMMHCENNDVIRWVTRRLLANGYRSPKFHAIAHHAIAESEATHRAISFARMLEVPILIVHVSDLEAVRIVHSAQVLGAPIYAESCPQYLLLTAEDLDLPGMDGAKFCCSPPPRDPQSQKAIWQGLSDGTLQVVSSDHSPFRFDASGKLPNGAQTSFDQIPNGLPGIELRLPLLFSEGVVKGRLSIEQFAKLTATNHAKMYGLYPRKGVIQEGSDADLAIWNPAMQRTISWDMLHDNTGYTPYEGRSLTGWPVTVVSGGRIIVEGGALHAEKGSGRFLKCGCPEPILQNRGRRASAGHDTTKLFRQPRGFAAGSHT